MLYDVGDYAFAKANKPQTNSCLQAFYNGHIQAVSVHFALLQS
ncbi:MAG: hypothetical protein NWQ09_03285 [Nonlabens sp.]|nr:hypothetical protein [Nonlabens sp.]